MLYNVHVGTAWCPVQHIELVFLEPFLCNPRGVLRIVVLLEIHIFFLDAEVLQGPKYVVLENFGVKRAIHVAIDLNNAAHPG